jgi:hypothetical protein
MTSFSPVSGSPVSATGEVSYFADIDVPVCAFDLGLPTPTVLAIDPVNLSVPLCDFTLTAHVPFVGIPPEEVFVPVCGFTLEAFAPEVPDNQSANISVPRVLFTLDSHTPDFPTYVRVDSTVDFALASFAPTVVAFDSRVAVPAASFTLTAYPPRITRGIRWQVSESIASTDTPTARAGTPFTPVESTAMTDSARYSIATRLAESLGLTDALQALSQAAQVFGESIRLGDTPAYAIQSALSETANLNGRQLAGVRILFGDTADLADNPRAGLKTLFGDTFAITDAARAAFVFEASESFTLADAPTFNLFAMMTGREGIAFHTLLTLDDGDYELWAFNAKTLGATRYVGVQFNSLASFNGRTFGVDETGLYALEGSSDDGEPIDSYFETGMISFGSPLQEKRNRRVYLYGESSDTVILKVFTDTRNGCREEAAYRLEADLGDSTLGARTTKIGGGLRGTHWKFRVENLSGATLDVRGMEVLPANFTYKP